MIALLFALACIETAPVCPSSVETTADGVTISADQYAAPDALLFTVTGEGVICWLNSSDDQVVAKVLDREFEPVDIPHSKRPVGYFLRVEILGELESDVSVELNNALLLIEAE